MSLTTTLRRFFGIPDPAHTVTESRSSGSPAVDHHAHTITKPRSSGSPVVDHHANRSTPAQPLGTPRPPTPPQPRTWHIVSGEGYVMGVATEDPEDYTISVGWHPSFKERLAKARTRWVDYEAFHDHITDTSSGSLAHIYEIPTPIRVRSRDPREAEMDDRRRRGLAW